MSIIIIIIIIIIKKGRQCKAEREKKIKLKAFDITMSTYISKNNKLFRLKYNTDTSCRKGEYVHKANF